MYPNYSILTEKGWMLAKDIKAGDNIQTKDGCITVVSNELETLSDKGNVYNFNVLGYHTYVVGSDLIVVHNNCTNTKEGATKKVEYNYNGKRTAAYNKGGGDVYFDVDRSRHGGSAFKGFELSRNHKKLEWIGDFDEMLNAIPNKHKSPQTIIFDVIKITQLK